MEIEISQNDADAQFIRERLNEFNYARVPHDNHETLTLVVRREGKIVAGLTGDTYWGWLYISLFWVDESLRGQGLGGEILARAEDIARERGCHSAHLETHDFQNLEFYQKRGYALFGQLDDLPVGHTKYYLWKRLRTKN
jgi:GNAT superfamily N-acetyltransferase